MHVSVRLSACLLSDCSSVCLYVCLSVCLYVCLCVCLSVCLSVCLLVCLSVCMSVCRSVCLCLSVCLIDRVQAKRGRDNEDGKRVYRQSSVLTAYQDEKDESSYFCSFQPRTRMKLPCFSLCFAAFCSFCYILLCFSSYKAVNTGQGPSRQCPDRQGPSTQTDR